MKLTAADFELWRHAPITELILDRLLGGEMALTKARHDDEAWSGPLLPEQHAAFRERYETLEWLRTLTFEQIEGWLGAEQETDG